MAHYLKTHEITYPDLYTQYIVDDSFTNIAEIEQAKPESFLYQAGYLTCVEEVEGGYILDYPNDEVRIAIAQLYQESIYNIREAKMLGTRLWEALCEDDFAEVIRLYNTELSALPYTDFQRADEGFYRSVFLVMLRTAAISAYAEVPTRKGRSDVVIATPKTIHVLEFKLAKDASAIPEKKAEGLRQIGEKAYLEPFALDKQKVLGSCIVIDCKDHSAFFFPF